VTRGLLAVSEDKYTMSVQ